MGVGKYSPTVTRAYMADQEWHDKLCPTDDWYDDEGYDSYGYHKTTEQDREGYTELDYLSCGEWFDDEYYYPLYDDVSGEWGFDGTRPVRKRG